MEALPGCSDQASFRIATLSRCFRQQSRTKRTPLAPAGGKGRGQAGRVGLYRRHIGCSLIKSRHSMPGLSYPSLTCHVIIPSRQDYHAILIYAPDERAVVYDLESSLPFPTHFWKYATETFRSDEAVRPEFHRKFRLVPASIYLQQFASSRHHMKREDGTWIKTPPDYPPISTPST